MPKKKKFIYRPSTPLKRRDSFCVFNSTTYGNKVVLGAGVFGEVYKMTSIDATINVNQTPQEIAVKLIKPPFFELAFTDENIRGYLHQCAVNHRKEAEFNRQVFGIGYSYVYPRPLIIENELNQESQKMVRTLKSYPQQYIVMPYFQGTQLSTIKSNSLAQHVGIFRALLKTLHSLHTEKKIVHGDLHLGNILIDKCGKNYKVILIDYSFGAVIGDEITLPYGLDFEFRAPEIKDATTITAQVEQDYFTTGFIFIILLNKIAVNISAEMENLFDEATEELEQIYRNLTQLIPRDRLTPLATLALLDQYEENFRINLFKIFKLAQEAIQPFDLKKWLQFEYVLHALKNPEEDAIALFDKYIAGDVAFYQMEFTKKIKNDFTYFITTLTNLPDPATQLEWLQTLATNDHLARVIKKPADLTALQALFADDRNIRRELCIILLNSYKTLLIQTNNFANNAELIDRWCFAERLLLGLAKNPDYSLTYVKNSIETLLQANWPSKLGVVNLTQRGIETTTELITMLEGLPFKYRSCVLSHINSLPTKNSFYQQIKLATLLEHTESQLALITKGYDATQPASVFLAERLALVTHPQLPVLNRLSHIIGAEAANIIVRQACIQFFADRGSNMREALQALDTFSYNTELYQTILIACNDVYIQKRAANDQSRYSAFSLFSKTSKLAGAHRLANKLDSFNISRLDLLEPVLNQGDLGEIVGRLKRTLQ